MRGEVLHYDQEQGFGFITGADGKRYSFAREDLRREMALARGAEVEFQPNGDRAGNIFSVRAHMAGPAEGAAPAAAAAAPLGGSAPVAPAHFGRNAENGTTQSTGLWDYFWRDLTTNYVNFSGRARRKEFWGFCLFWTIGLAVIVGVGLSVDLGSGIEQGDDLPIVMIGLVVLYILLTFLPWVALLVRRLHDLGLTGWLAVLCFLPYVGWLATLVFALIPTQAGDNKWGPVPVGVRF